MNFVNGSFQNPFLQQTGFVPGFAQNVRGRGGAGQSFGVSNFQQHAGDMLNVNRQLQGHWRNFLANQRPPAFTPSPPVQQFQPAPPQTITPPRPAPAPVQSQAPEPGRTNTPAATPETTSTSQSTTSTSQSSTSQPSTSSASTLPAPLGPNPSIAEVSAFMEAIFKPGHVKLNNLFG